MEIYKEIKDNLKFTLNKFNIESSKIERICNSLNFLLKEYERLKTSNLKSIYIATKSSAKRAFIVKLLIEKGLTIKQIMTILEISISGIYTLKKTKISNDYAFKEKIIKIIGR